MYSGVNRVARGGSGAKAPSLAARPDCKVADLIWIRFDFSSGARWFLSRWP